MNEIVLKGFTEKCAQLGINPRIMMKYAAGEQGFDWKALGEQAKNYGGKALNWAKANPELAGAGTGALVGGAGGLILGGKDRTRNAILGALGLGGLGAGAGSAYRVHQLNKQEAELRLKDKQQAEMQAEYAAQQQAKQQAELQAKQQAQQQRKPVNRKQIPMPPNPEVDIYSLDTNSPSVQAYLEKEYGVNAELVAKQIQDIQFAARGSREQASQFTSNPNPSLVEAASGAIAPVMNRLRPWANRIERVEKYPANLAAYDWNLLKRVPGMLGNEYTGFKRWLGQSTQ